MVNLQVLMLHLTTENTQWEKTNAVFIIVLIVYD